MTVAVWRPTAGNTNGAILRMDEVDEAALIAAVLDATFEDEVEEDDDGVSGVPSDGLCADSIRAEGKRLKSKGTI